MLINKKAFTVLEVIITLAIAAMVLVIVFIVVPSLTRQSRNNRIKNDANRFLLASQEYSRSQGTGNSFFATGVASSFPADGSTSNISVTNNLWFRNLVGNMNSTAGSEYVVTFRRESIAAGGGATLYNAANKMMLVQNHICNGRILGGVQKGALAIVFYQETMSGAADSGCQDDGAR